MHKIDTDTAVGNEFVDGNAAASIKATRLNAKWFNTVQRELCKIVESAEIALSDADDAQIVAAMAILFEQALLSKSHEGDMTFVNRSGQTASISGGKISLNGTNYKIEIDATTGEISILSTEFGGFSLKWNNCANITDSLVVDGSITAIENLLAKGFIGFVDDKGKSDDYTKIEPGQVSTNGVKASYGDFSGLLKAADGKFSVQPQKTGSEGNFICRLPTTIQNDLSVTEDMHVSGLLDATIGSFTRAHSESFIQLPFVDASTEADLKGPSAIIRSQILKANPLKGDIVMVRNMCGHPVEFNYNSEHSSNGGVIIVAVGESILYAYDGSYWRKVW